MADKLNFDLGMKLLVQDGDDTFLRELTDLSAANAATLAKYKGELHFPSLITLTDEAAVEIANFKGYLNLCGLTALSDIAAEALSRHVGVLDLSGLNSLSDTAAEALSKHKNDLIPPHALSPRIAVYAIRRCAEGILRANQSGIMMAINLQNGILYDCTVESYDNRANAWSDAEDHSVVQLAIDVTTTRRVLLENARNLYTQDPDRVHKLINMSFYELDTTDFNSSPDYSDWSAMIRSCIIMADGTLKDEYSDTYLEFFTATDVIGH